MSKLTEYREKFGTLDGWFDETSQAIWDCLLSYQADNNIHGNLLEIGVAYGKSATLMALHARDDEQGFFVDAMMDTAKPILADLLGEERLTFIKAPSEALNTPNILSQWHRRFRWIHIDGEHTGMAVANDLAIADAALHRTGIVSLDDFFNPGYPQVARAVFRYLDAHPDAFSLILCGFHKAYLCRPYHSPSLRLYLYKELRKDLTARGAAPVTLWRSTVPDDMNAFGITPQEEHGTFRGPDWAPDLVLL